jgi:hypothetical protein
MISSLLEALLTRESRLPESVPAEVGVYRSKWIPTVVGLLSGMREPATAVTLGDAIIVHPKARLTTRILRHELEHVRQWQAEPVLFPVRYAWNQLKHGYDRNPYEIAARRAESSPRKERT